MLKPTTVLLAVVVFVFAPFYPCLAQTEQDWHWVNRHFHKVLEEYLPIKEKRGYSLGYRSYRDLYTSELEYSFVFNRILQNKYISVVVREADSVSLYDQIMALHVARPDAGIEDIKKQLKVKERRLTEESCPTIKKEYYDFYRQSLSMASARERRSWARGEISITLHPRVHTFEANLSGGNLLLVLDDQEHPFVLWAKKTRHALESCQQTVSR